MDRETTTAQAFETLIASSNAIPIVEETLGPNLQAFLDELWNILGPQNEIADPTMVMECASYLLLRFGRSEILNKYKLLVQDFTKRSVLQPKSGGSSLDGQTFKTVGLNGALPLLNILVQLERDTGRVRHYDLLGERRESKQDK